MSPRSEMEKISSKLRELEKVELDLYDEWKNVLLKWSKADQKTKKERETQEAEWSERLLQSIEEQDKLRQNRRELAKGPSKLNPSVATDAIVMIPSVSKRPLPDSKVPVSKKRAVPENRRSTTGTRTSIRDGKIVFSDKLSFQTQPRGSARVGGTNWFPVAYDDDHQPLYERPSDGKLVYLDCCHSGCDRTGFSSVKQLMKHASHEGVKNHNGKKLVLSTACNAVETCGRLAPRQEAQEEIGSRNPASADVELRQSRSAAAQEMFRDFLSSDDESEDEDGDKDEDKDENVENDESTSTSFDPSTSMHTRLIGSDLRAQLLLASNSLKKEQDADL